MISPVIIVIAIVACSFLCAVVETMIESKRGTKDTATCTTETTKETDTVLDISEYMPTRFPKSIMRLRTESDIVVHDTAPLASRTCPNCGAPVRGTECEYCGTVFTSNSIAKRHPALPNNMDTSGFVYSDNP